MNVSLTPELEKFIQKRVKSGMYQSASEVVREALRSLEEQELAKRRREGMNAFIQEGIDSGKNGEFVTPEELDADLDKLFAELEAEHAKKLSS